MKGRVIVLAGGSGGLGAAVAEEIARRGGIPVIGCLTHTERARDIAAKLRSDHGIEAPVAVGDVRESEGRSRLLSEAARAGVPYGMVSLIGHPARVPIESATSEDLLNSMRVNFVGPVLLARDFAQMAVPDASVVFVSTMQGVA